MRAMILRQSRPIEENPLALEDVAPPELKQGRLLIKVKACGVCHTDLHTVEGDIDLPVLPIIPGHQVVGHVVTSLQSGRFAAGDRVGVTWFYSSCGECEFCLSGRENLCATAEFTGLHENGGYAGYMAVPETSVFSIPPIFSDVDAVPLLCGGVIGYRAFRLSEIRPGERLGMYGFGNSAHVIVQIAASKGCKVHVFTRSPKHQALAEELGAVWVGGPDTQPPAPMHSSIIFAPAGELIPKALANLQRGGTLALAGITMTSIPQMDYSLIYGERTVRSVANTTRQDAAELLESAAAVPVQTVIEKFPLDQANEVLTMMKTGYLKAGAVLIP
jgi:alcohol dehydrogenase, propanol-preferring